MALQRPMMMSEADQPQCQPHGLPRVHPSPPRMARPNDARALRSQKALHQALLRLIEHRPFASLSIRDIIKEASLSYPAFYRRYENKEQLLEDIATSEVGKLLSLCLPIFRESDSEGSLISLLQYVERHKALWRNLLTGGAAPVMRSEFARIAKQIGTAEARSNPDPPLELLAGVAASGLFEILSWWLSQAPPYPLPKLAKILDQVIVRALTTPLNLSSSHV